MVGIRFYDTNDKVDFTIINPVNPAIEAGVVADIKARMASISGVGTIIAAKTTESTTNL